MLEAVNDPKIHRILFLPELDENEWKSDLRRFAGGDMTLTRTSAGESSIKAVQRLMIFLGYSTSSTGAFGIDGDFGRGTNRGNAQFQFEHNLTNKVNRRILCYDCNWQNASRNIVAIPDVKLTVTALDKMLNNALHAINTNQVMCGDFNEAVFHLNNLHRGSLLSCKRIFERYGDLVEKAIRNMRNSRGITIQPEWIFSIMRQETAGIVRPRFEQHLLTRYNGRNPGANFAELRYQSMSFGLGQILGVNFQRVGAPSAKAMFFSSLEDQALYIARFLASKKSTIAKSNPTDADFRVIARYYNGPGYESHHYHERIATWFREFKALV